MARTKEDPAPHAGPGRNSPLTDGERDALLITHVASIRAQQGKHDLAKTEAQAEGKELGDRFRLAKVELGATYTRAFIETEILKRLDRQRGGDFLAYEEARRQVGRVFGFKDGQEQGDLLLNMPETAREEERWRALGFETGKQGLDQVIPDGCPPIFHATYEHAYADGQRTLADAWETRRRLEADALLAEAGVGGGDEDGEGDDGGEEDFDADEQAERLRRGGFMEAGEPEQDAA